MIKPDELTIVFTTFDELDCLKLAIYSFLEFYPQYKSSIVVFDDNSGPEISDWLLEEGIRRITWEKKTFVSDFASYIKIYPILSMSLRNSWMLTEIVKRTETRYLMINDNDLVFLKPGFMETYFALIEQGYLAVAQYETYNYGWRFSEELSPQLIDGFLGKYSLLYNVCSKEMERLHWCHGIMNVSFLKSLDICFDGEVDQKFIWLILQGSVAETGTSFFYLLKKNGLPYFKLNNVYNRMVIDERKAYLPFQNCEYDIYDVYHLRWVSSSTKIAQRLGGSVDRSVLNANHKIASDLDSCAKLRTRIEILSKRYSLNILNRFKGSSRDQ